MNLFSISQTPDRDFVLRISALEIYNETVIDLLNRESGPLRLLDDPEVWFIGKAST
jgi:centromeric protein E